MIFPPISIILVVESSFIYKKSCLTTIMLNPRVIWSSHLILDYYSALNSRVSPHLCKYHAGIHPYHNLR